ncbi:MAG: EamA family transporter RarD [Treponema sp.]|nr:EamA family transporter RarD [Treponema sp.]
MLGADKIAVLDQGRLVGEGAGEELLARGGLSARLYRIQQESLGWAAGHEQPQAAEEFNREQQRAALPRRAFSGKVSLFQNPAGFGIGSLNSPVSGGGSGGGFMERKSFGEGVFFALVSFLLWGVLPVYWHFLASINPFHILAARILLSAVLTALILLARKNTAWLRALARRPSLFFLAGSSALITANWGVYIWAVNSGHTVDCSLGYYINPLLSVVLGLVFFRERLLPLQWAAFGIACAGVLLLTVLSGVFPWIALLIALSFGFYGLIKKKTPCSSLESLGAETLLASPVALLLLAFCGGGFGGLAKTVPPLWMPVLLAGPITTIPLYFFSKGTRILPLSAVGFMQFINPTLQFFSGVVILKEPFPVWKLPAFIVIWAAVILYSLSLIPGKKKEKRHV